MRTFSSARVESLESRRLLTTYYSLTDLGTLGGVSSRPLDINDAGDVVGYATDAGGNTRAFLYHNGAMAPLAGLTTATQVNNAGKILGAAPGGPTLWNNGVITDLGLDPQAILTGLNDSGQIVGNLNGHAFLVDNGVSTDLGSLTSIGGANASDINNAGQIAGYSATDQTTALGLASVHTFISQSGHLNDVGTPAFTMGSYGYAINSSGQMVGAETVYLNSGYGAAVVSYPFFFDGANFLQLLALSYNSFATDINDSGQIIGIQAGGPFLYQNGKLQSLNALLPPGSPTLGGATAINNAGQIIAYTSGANSHAVLLTPDHIDVPSPARPTPVAVSKSPKSLAPVWSSVQIAAAKRPKPVAAPRHR